MIGETNYSLVKVNSVKKNNTENWSYSGLDIFISVPTNIGNKDELLRVLSDAIDEWMEEE